MYNYVHWTCHVCHRLSSYQLGNFLQIGKSLPPPPPTPSLKHTVAPLPDYIYSLIVLNNTLGYLRIKAL